MGGQCVLDLGQLDPVTADLDLVVRPSQQREHPVGQQPSKVAGPVHAGARHVCEGIREEALGREVGTVRVATGDARTADEQLAGHALRDWTTARVEHIATDVVDRPADRHGPSRPIRRAVHLVHRRPYSRLGGPVKVPKRAAAHDHRVEQVHRHRLTAVEGSQVRLTLPTVVDQHLPRRRCRLHDGHAGPMQQGGQRSGIDHRVAVGDHDLGSVDQGQEQLEH